MRVGAPAGGVWPGARRAACRWRRQRRGRRSGSEANKLHLGITEIISWPQMLPSLSCNYHHPPVLLGRNVDHKLLALGQSLQSEFDLFGHCVRPELIQVAATVSFELGAHLESIWSNTVPRPQTAVQSR